MKQRGTRGKISGNYDPVSNRFTQEFQNRMNAKFENKLLQAPWIISVLVYTNILDIFTEAFQTKIDKELVLNQLYKFVSPNTGNPSGILAVIKLINHLISIMTNLVGVSATSSSQRKNLSSTKQLNLSSKKSSKKSFKITKFFNNSFDSNAARDVGFDYLSNRGR